ncbi:MAG TPA: ABC transporter permease subunit, partial [Thermomicrobiaceae bacterium]|nr:ABC transporter permease subunit [Thermomicrobiaceae bacterium]
SMMSWAGGWFFLMAAEQFTLGNKSFRLPGLGSYLATAAGKDDISALLLGLLTLVIIIILLDQFIWRPLVAWGERFKVEQVPSADVPRSWVLTALQRSYLLRRVETAYHHLARGNSRRPHLETSSGQPGLGFRRSVPYLHRAAAWLVGAGALALVGWAISLAIPLLSRLQPHDVLTLLGDSGATLTRTLIALLVAVLWTVPVGVWIGMNPKLARRAQPIVQMVASIPATALFPVLLLIFLDLPAGIDIAAVLLMLLGTQWYVLFNVIAGAMAIPSDLREASSIFKMSRWLRWRSLILPAIFPYLVTGMITATGGAWNASIVAEYVSFGSKTVSTRGLGSLIAESAGSGNFALLLAGTLSMSIVVVLMNRLVWHRLYHLAETRYRLD